MTEYKLKVIPGKDEIAEMKNPETAYIYFLAAITERLERGVDAVDTVFGLMQDLNRRVAELEQEIPEGGLSNYIEEYLRDQYDLDARLEKLEKDKSESSEKNHALTFLDIYNTLGKLDERLAKLEKAAKVDEDDPFGDFRTAPDKPVEAEWPEDVRHIPQGSIDPTLSIKGGEGGGFYIIDESVASKAEIYVNYACGDVHALLEYTKKWLAAREKGDK